MMETQKLNHPLSSEMLKTKKVSLFHDFVKVHSDCTLEVIMQFIKQGDYQKPVNSIRQALEDGKSELASKLKKQLPAVTISGTFANERNKARLNDYSAIITLDYDKLSKQQLTKLQSDLAENQHVLAYFLSPSGKGIKVLVPVDSPHEVHENAFSQVVKTFEEMYEIPIDRSGKDVSRLCFLSYDPDLYVNNDAQSFSIQQKSRNNYEALLKQAMLITGRKFTYEDGNRNNYIHHLACNANRLGIPLNCLKAALPEQFDLDREELLRTIDGVYTKNDEEHGSGKKYENRIDQLENLLNSRYEFRYNEVTQRIEFQDKEAKSPDFINLTDYHENSILRWVLKNGIKVNQTLLRSLLRSDFSINHNPFVAYFQSLPEWDGKDYIQELSEHVKTHNDALWSKALKKWLVAMVACSIMDKVNHTALIFSGKQGIGKTTFIIKLIPEQLSQYVFSGTINPNNKDAFVQLSECLLINMDELENMNKTEIGSIKQLITEGSIRIRKAYGTNQENLTRRASFAGSVNSMNFLNDMTGSRRFLCFDVENIQYEAAINHQGIYSQAMHLIKTGFQYWFDKDEIDEITSNNEQFQIVSHEEETLLNFFEPVAQEEAELFLTNTEILAKLQSKTGFQNLRSKALGHALMKHNFSRSKRNGQQVYAVIEKSIADITMQQKQNS